MVFVFCIGEQRILAFPCGKAFYTQNSNLCSKTILTSSNRCCILNPEQMFRQNSLLSGFWDRALGILSPSNGPGMGDKGGTADADDTGFQNLYDVRPGQGGGRSLADCWAVPTQAPAEPRVLPVPVPISRPRRRSSRLRRCALAMDVLASLGVVAMTAAFTFWVLAI